MGHAPCEPGARSGRWKSGAIRHTPNAPAATGTLPMIDSASQPPASLIPMAIIADPRAIRTARPILLLMKFTKATSVSFVNSVYPGGYTEFNSTKAVLFPISTWAQPADDVGRRGHRPAVPSTPTTAWQSSEIEPRWPHEEVSPTTEDGRGSAMRSPSLRGRAVGRCP